MTDRRNTQISLRRQPKQARSTDLVSTILDAAIQVLAKEGVHRFNTGRVAKRAGDSVGSLYQYFPNKAALLFRLQCDEWRQTTQLLGSILGNAQRPPLERLRILVHAFIRSECDEAEMRVGLNGAAPLYRDAPEAQETRASADPIFRVFMKEALPEALETTRALAGDLISTTLRVVGKQFSERPRTPAEIEAYAEAMANMFSAYLKGVHTGAHAPSDHIKLRET